MPQKRPLEIVVTSARGAATAVSAGADRLELCEALEIGGITANPELVVTVLMEATGVGVHALIRPRGGTDVGPSPTHRVIWGGRIGGGSS